MQFLEELELESTGDPETDNPKKRRDRSWLTPIAERKTRYSFLKKTRNSKDKCLECLYLQGRKEISPDSVRQASTLCGNCNSNICFLDSNNLGVCELCRMQICYESGEAYVEKGKRQVPVAPTILD